MEPPPSKGSVHRCACVCAYACAMLCRAHDVPCVIRRFLRCLRADLEGE